jgi:three-Cys-motif partner protein
MIEFGGDWTKNKIEILVKYAKAYLKIMKDKTYWKLLYFDGFAGSGFIVKDKMPDIEITIGTARRIVEIEEPRGFDHYYFVEKNKANAKLLASNTKDVFPNKEITIREDDCNVKLTELSRFLLSPNGRKFRVLAYIDPYGMQVEWKSIKNLSKTKIDIWILVPTGMGVNRLLKKNGEISEIWLNRLELFLGMDSATIKSLFYKTETDLTLFGEEEHIKKEKDAINMSAKIYEDRLKSVFSFVSQPYILKSSQGNIMYHMFMASNNGTAVKIADQIIKKYNAIEEK